MRIAIGLALTIAVFMGICPGASAAENADQKDFFGFMGIGKPSSSTKTVKKSLPKKPILKKPVQSISIAPTPRDPNRLIIHVPQAPIQPVEIIDTAQLKKPEKKKIIA